MWLVLRILVLLLAVAGAGASAFFGLVFAVAINESKTDPKANPEVRLKDARAAAKIGRLSPSQLEREEEIYREQVRKLLGVARA
jgi:hypothetical protein